MTIWYKLFKMIMTLWSVVDGVKKFKATKKWWKKNKTKIKKKFKRFWK